MPSSGAATHPGSNARTNPPLPNQSNVSGNSQPQGSRNYPNIETVQRSLGFFTLFAVLLAIAAQFSTKAFQVIIIIAGALCFVGPATDNLLNYRRRVRKSSSIFCISGLIFGLISWQILATDPIFATRF
jgi:predicted PurR-regulated permease PerM